VDDGEPDNAEPVVSVPAPVPRVKALSRENYGLLLAFIGMLIFSGTVPATRLAVGGLDAFFVTAARAAIAGVLAVALLLVLRRPWPSHAQLRPMIIGALCMVIGFPGFAALGLRTVPAADDGGGRRLDHR
jgi:drug/metabolite transporter (DMT)-like permease